MSSDSDARNEIAQLRAQRAETRRVTVPALEEILYEPIPVLDHGFVRVIDYMGDDAAIVQAARVSYGRGTKKVREDRGLIRYLMRHRHTTPFEMCEIKFHCKMPIFVARQWIRHRTACLTGDTRISFDLPGARRRGNRQHHAVTIEKLHRLWHEGSRLISAKKKPVFLDRVAPETDYTIPELSRLVERREEDLRNLVRAGRLEGRRTQGRIFVRGEAWRRYAVWSRTMRTPMRDRLTKMQVRMCDEATGTIEHTTLTDIWETGLKPVFRVTLENGYTLTMTKDHRCLTGKGWLTLEQATRLRSRADGGVTWDGGAPALAVNGVPLHRSREWLARQREAGANLQAMATASGMTTHTIRKSLRTFGLQFSAGERACLSGAAQRGQRRVIRRRDPLGPEALARLREARGGAASNFWKGGVTPERANIGRWTRERAARVHERNGWKCVICKLNIGRLHAHHADPVWHNPTRARDESNLTTLCEGCHKDIHRLNLELEFLSAYENRPSLAAFWTDHPTRGMRPDGKRLPRVRRLMRAYSRIALIEYVGIEKTYDLEVSGPYHNFVANGFIVHNSVNEYSARYSLLDKEFYIPKPEDLGLQATGNRQGRGDAVSPARAAHILKLLKEDAETAYAHYLDFLGLDQEPGPDEAGDGNRKGPALSERGNAERVEGLARELARMNLNLGYYTQWYWKIDLHNLLHFLSLRMDPHAQMEIRVFADAMGSCVKRWVPAVWEAFEDYRLGAASFSRQEVEALRQMIAGKQPDLESLGLSKREQAEFWKRLGLAGKE